MLRTRLVLGRQLVDRSRSCQLPAQWHATRGSQHIFRKPLSSSHSLFMADKPSITDPSPSVLPGTSSKSASQAQPPPPGPVSFESPPPPSSTLTPATQNIPKVPPPPTNEKTQTSPGTSIPSNTLAPRAPSVSSVNEIPPPPPPPPRKPRRFRRYLFYLVFLSGLGYAGGVYYSLLSDNFHDFFTEYVPFGEDAVLYFEEREYRKRFPNITNPTSRPVVEGHKVTIPGKSGVSWKVSGEDKQGSDLQAKGPHMNAVDKKSPERVQQKVDGVLNKTPAPGTKDKPTNKEPPQKAPAAKAAASPPKSTSPATPVPEVSKTAEKPTSAPLSAPILAEASKTKDPLSRPPEVDEPSRIMPIAPIDQLKIEHADEPLVQDLVKILNDIIVVVNNDSSSGKYSSTVNKAKSALSDVGRRIISLKENEKKAATEQIRSLQAEFDRGAQELIRRVEAEDEILKGHWRDEFDAERDKIARSYQQRLSTEMQRAQEVMDQRIKNELLQQAITLKKQFLSEVTTRVETERDGRLSKLEDLSSGISELEKLTAEWNAVVDANLKTQHLQVAVEAVRSTLENSERARPFVNELAALKEIADNDSVINAAIASINPTAYQRGVPTKPQLIDRFRRVADEVRKSALLPEDAGVASHAASFVLSKFLFKKRGLTVGDDVESVLTRTETLLEEGRLDEAAREMNTLDGWAKTLSWDWLSEVRRVLEVRQALDVIATEARLEGLKADA